MVRSSVNPVNPVNSVFAWRVARVAGEDDTGSERNGSFGTMEDRGSADRYVNGDRARGAAVYHRFRPPDGVRRARDAGHLHLREPDVEFRGLERPGCADVQAYEGRRVV